MSEVASAPGGEAASKKKKVSQVAILVGIVVVSLLLVVAGVRGSRGALQLAVPSEQIQPRPEQPALDAIAREAERLADFGQRTTEPSPNDDLSRPPRGGQGREDPAYLNALLENLSARSQAPVTSTSTPLLDVEKKRDELHKMLSEPMRGVVATQADRFSGASQSESTGVRSLPPGTVIEARSTMEVSSDYPGSPFAAITTRPSHFANGDVAIPAGSTILCTVEQDTGPNQILQGRVGVRLSQIVLPDGEVIAVKDAARVLDSRGVAAIPGKTNRHILAQTAGVLAGAVLGAAQLGAAGEEPFSSRDAVEGEAIAGATQQASPFVQRYLSVQPTVIPKSGTPVRIFLVEPLPIPAA